MHYTKHTRFLVDRDPQAEYGSAVMEEAELRENLQATHAAGVRGIFCCGCKKQRHAPRIPEAMHGWVRRRDGYWECPDCRPIACGVAVRGE